MKKRNILIGIVTFIILLVCVFQYFHPTHYAYNDRFVVGNSQAEIVKKYGEFDVEHRNEAGELTCGIYMIRDNMPELIMGYDDSLWYEVYFENKVAVEVKLREGYLGG